MHLTTGIDLVEVHRMKTAVEKWGDRLLNRVWTPQEIEYSRQRICFYQHLAARFAAKEAVIKCLGQEEINQRSIGWKDIEVVNNSEGKPEIRFNQEKQQSKKRISLSISHTKDYAVAQAIVYE